MATIVHFDVPAKDMNRAKEFYETLFGWKIDGVPRSMEYFNIPNHSQWSKIRSWRRNGA